MNIKIDNQKLAPPRLIPTLLEGFNTVANHIGLILFPLGLDLLIWFGPQLKLEKLLTPIYTQAFQALIAYNNPEMQQLLDTSQSEIGIILVCWPIKELVEHLWEDQQYLKCLQLV